MISVCMATYNGARFIREQIDSILPQLGTEDELIISDDGSMDGTLGIIEAYADSRIVVLKGSCFRSPIYNLENALKKVRGDYIFLSDQDDVWLNNKVSVCLEAMNGYDLVVHDADIVDADGNRLFDSFYAINHTRKGKFYNLLKNGYLGCCMCLSKRLLDAILPFPAGLPMHDIYIGNYAAFNGYKVRFIADRLIHYRRHGNNASITSERSHRSMASRLLDRIMILKNI